MIVLWILLILIIIMVLASLMPFSVYISGERWDDKLQYSTTFYWPWKLIGIGIRRDKEGKYTQIMFGNHCIFKRVAGKKRKEKKKREKEKKEKKSKLSGILQQISIFTDLAKAVLRFLRDLLHSFYETRVSGEVEVGISDPAAMGVISGILYSISPSGVIFGGLKVYPNYIDTILIGEVNFRTSVLPMRIYRAVIKLVFRLPLKDLIRMWRQKRRKNSSKEDN